MENKIDLSYLEEVTGGSNDIIQEMLELFLSETPQQLQLLKEKSRASDWEKVRAEAHKLKPTFMYVGLAGSHEKLVTIENYARNEENLQQIQETIDSVANDFENSKEEISELIKKFN